MKAIDDNILAGYNAGIERGRLHHGLGLIEFARTKEILREQLPPPPAVVYDIGGAYGEYAYWLAGLGTAYFHRPAELKAEIEAAGFADVKLRGVIGPCWMIRNLDKVWGDAHKRESILRVVRLFEKEESLMGGATHFLSISKKW